VSDLSIQEVSLYAHLVEVLCFFIRQHSYRSKYFILSEGLAARVGQLMSCPEKHLKLSTAAHHLQVTIADATQPLSNTSARSLPCTTKHTTGRSSNINSSNLSYKSCSTQCHGITS
jgi:hypothetical protein